MSDNAKETLGEFNDTSARLLEILSSSSQKELDYTTADKWSIGSIGDHLLKSYASVDTLNGNTEPTDRPMDEKLEPIKTLFLDRSIKMDSPQAILPARGSIDKEALISEIENRFEQTREVIQHKDLSLVCTDYAIPVYGPFTRFEWIWFNLYHTQRHIMQMQDMVNQKRVADQ